VISKGCFHRRTLKRRAHEHVLRLPLASSNKAPIFSYPFLSFLPISLLYQYMYFLTGKRDGASSEAGGWWFSVGRYIRDACWAVGVNDLRVRRCNSRVPGEKMSEYSEVTLLAPLWAAERSHSRRVAQ
jgi:hypothetical protein